MDANERDYDEYEGPTCPSCDGLVAPNAISCPCGTALVEMADPCEGMSFEERMAFEVMMENRERAEYGAPLIPVVY